MRIGPLLFQAGLLPTLATAAMLCLLLWLGFWQLGRAEYKLRTEAAFDQRRADVPVALNRHATMPGTSQQQVALYEYRRATAIGTFDSAHQFLLDNQVHGGVVGYHVYSPFKVAGIDYAILVNRGWVPLGPSRDRLPRLETTAGRDQIAGTLSRPIEGGILLGDPGYGGGGWPAVVQQVDLAAMQSRLGYELAGMVLLLDPAASGGYAREWRAVYGMRPARHRAYALQWFSLAVALTVIYLFVSVRRSQPSESGQ